MDFIKHYFFYIFIYINFFFFSCQHKEAHSHNHKNKQNQNFYTELEVSSLHDFSFKNQQNKDFIKENLLGKWNLLFFGYTNCPDICPPTLYELAKVYKKFEKNTKNFNKLQVIFVSVDPKRDRIDLLANYIKNFHLSFQAIVSSEEETILLAKQLGIFFYKTELSVEEKKHSEHLKELPKRNYLINHSGSILLVNPKGDLVGVFSTPHNSQNIFQVLKQII